MDFKQIFTGIKCPKDEREFEVFKSLKPVIIEKLKACLEARHLKHTGRPITTDFNQFLDALFFIVESGSQIRYVKRLFGIPKTTFNRYLKIFIENHILIDIYNEIIKNTCLPKH